MKAVESFVLAMLIHVGTILFFTVSIALLFGVFFALAGYPFAVGFRGVFQSIIVEIIGFMLGFGTAMEAWSTFFKETN
jgi:hypothetical protein